MKRRSAGAAMTLAALILFAAPAGAAGSLACLRGQVATVELSQNARTLDNTARPADQSNMLRDIVLADAQGLGLATTATTYPARLNQISTAKHSDDQSTMRITVALNSSERRLASAYLSGDQWPLRTVTLSLRATVTDMRSGKPLADMDVPALNLAAASTYEALADYLAHDFRDALASMLAVTCEEPVMAMQVAQPQVSRDMVSSRSRNGDVVVPGTAVPSSRMDPERHIAIVIGVSHYLNLRNSVPVGSRELANLRFADADAKLMSDFLTDTTSAAQHWEVHSFYNDQATKPRLDQIIRETLVDKAKSTDVILLYFAGHGRQNSSVDVGLLTYEFDPKDSTPGLSFNVIKDEIQASPAMQVIAFIDACDSGSVRLGARGSNIDTQLLAIEAGVGRMRTVIASAGNGESAYEDERLGHGVFTYFLMKAIHGGAQPSTKYGPKALLLGPVWDYVRANVSAYVQDHKDLFGPNASQRPTSFGNLNAQFNDWPIAR